MTWKKRKRISYFYDVKKVLGVLSLIWKAHVAVMFCFWALLFYPILVLILYSKNGKKRAFRVFVIWGNLYTWSCFYFVRKRMASPLPKAPYIIAANHSSYLDIFLMHSVFPKDRFLFLGKSEILKYPLIKTYFKKYNIPVYRGSVTKSARAFVSAAREVKKGWSLVIFPEATIPNENNPCMIEFKDGAFQLAKNLNIPIVPVTFTNNFKLFSDPSDLLGTAYPGFSDVYIHPYISAEEVAEMSQAELKELCFERINGPLKALYPNICK